MIGDEITKTLSEWWSCKPEMDEIQMSFNKMKELLKFC
jgi:hypothetical protein